MSQLKTNRSSIRPSLKTVDRPCVDHVDTLASPADVSSLEGVALNQDGVEPKAGASQLLHRGIDWPCVVWIGLVHVLALVAPFYFSWQASLLVLCSSC